MELRDAKNALRREIRSRLGALTAGDKAALDAGLFANVTAHPDFWQADTVLCYVSLPFEPDTRAVIEAAWAQGKRTAFPVCGAPGEMAFYLAGAWEEFVPGAFGILEPSSREEPVLTKHTVCIVPAFAFTPDGRRLGKGGGYYDRFLAAHPEIWTLGLTYAFLLQDDIPCEAHDIGVKAVLTDCVV